MLLLLLLLSCSLNEKESLTLQVLSPAAERVLRGH